MTERTLYPAFNIPGPALTSDLVVSWYRRAVQRRRLAELTPEMLADIGVDLDAARRESAKPFWAA